MSSAQNNPAASPKPRRLLPRNLLRRSTPLFLYFCAIVVLLFTVTGTHGLLQLMKLQSDADGLADKNRSLESSIADVNNKIFALDRYPFHLEKESREQLGLYRHGEVVYVFPHQQSESESH